MNIARIILILQEVYDNLNEENFSSLKYKSNLIGNTHADRANRQEGGIKIVVPLKHLSEFWRSLEMPLINCKVDLPLECYKNCILCSAGTAAIFTITDTKFMFQLLL